MSADSPTTTVRELRATRGGGWRRVLTDTGYFIGLPIIILVIWSVVSAVSPSFYFPGPIQIGTTFVETWFGERFFVDFLPSVGRLLLGLVLTIILGVVLGVIIGSVRWLRALTEPLFEFFRAVPPPVLVPVLMLLIGINDGMRIVVIISGAIWPVLLNTVEGVRAVDPVLRETARTYRITGFARYVHLVLPAASPQIMAGIRQCLSIALILMVISEMFGASSGLGFTIVLFQRSFAIAQMWSGIFLLGFIGIALSLLFELAERRVLGWYLGQRKANRAQ
ncbi:ABC transporter permease [Microbacterium gorillae]|uniref:ABC transporter permease n=1 Tax=Microbacterium gorillae TaxID=1231063 RepID=UPI0005910A11|nr:ABC transporter permease [Microbacterium gorillae]